MSTRCWTLAPDDLALLYEQCTRCFYLAIVHGFPRPRPEGGVLDGRLRAAFAGRRTEAVAAGMPPGVFEGGERAVQSLAFDVPVPDTIYRCAVRGSLDTVVRLDDGGYALADVCIAEWQEAPAPRHARRLHAWAQALENPAPGAPGLAPVRRLGVVVLEAPAVALDGGAALALTGPARWVEVPRDDGGFLGFLAEALWVLEQRRPPGGTPLCPWCVYRDASRRTGL